MYTQDRNTLALENSCIDLRLPNMTPPIDEVKEPSFQRKMVPNFAYLNLVSKGRGKLRLFCEFHTEGMEVHVWYRDNPFFFLFTGV